VTFRQDKAVGVSNGARRKVPLALPKGFRRARNYGFLHSSSKRLIQYLLNLEVSRDHCALIERPKIRCACCGAAMKIIRTRIYPVPDHCSDEGG
jgi:hypothetical protein